MFHFWKKHLFDELKAAGYKVDFATGGSPGYILKYSDEPQSRIKNLKNIFESDHAGSSKYILPKAV